MKNENEVITRLKSYEPLWNGWTYNDKLYGSGGSGCVLGLSREEERSVVKVIYIEDNQLKYNAVKDEIETMATLRSEYLVECLDYQIEEVYNRKGEKIGYDFLIHMNEYEPFSEFLREEEYDPNYICVQLTKEIGEALCVLHSNGILHRDIKPENIFIDSSSGKRHFRLGDFGVSKRIGDMSGLTTTGTLNFMAPESFKYYEYSYRSDIYNLGMTLYYILNDLRFPVFSEEESQSDFDYNTDCRLHGEKLPIPLYGSDALKKAVIKSCEANPKDRYKDISEMLNDLFGQNIPRMGKKLKIDQSSLPRRKSKHKNIIRIALIASIISLVALFISFVIYRVFVFQNNHTNKDVYKYDSSNISVALKKTPNKVEDALQKVVRTDSNSYNFQLDVSRNATYILHMSDKAINKYDTNLYNYDCFFEDNFMDNNKDNSRKLFYIFSEQGDSSYKMFFIDEELVCVIVSGESTLTYNYGNENITKEYYDIIKHAKEHFSEISEGAFYSYSFFFDDNVSLYYEYY